MFSLDVNRLMDDSEVLSTSTDNPNPNPALDRISPSFLPFV